MSAGATTAPVPGERNLVHVLAASVHDHAARTALATPELTLTYADLGERVVARAAALGERGVALGDPVALFLPNGIDYVISYLATVALGARAVPLDDRLPAPELARSLTWCQGKALIASRASGAACAAALASLERPVAHVVVEDEPVAAGHGGRLTLTSLAAALDPAAPAMLQLTSGSTGSPKGIARTHAMVVRELDALAEAFALSPEDRLLGAASFAHVNGLTRTMLTAIRAGAAVHPLARFARHEAADTITRERITVVIGVPIHFGVLAAAGPGSAPVKSIRLAVSASAPLPARVARDFAQSFGQAVRQLYGSTETGSISLNADADPLLAPESVGTPLPEVEIDLEPASDLPEGEGEVLVRSRWMFDGYAGAAASAEPVNARGFFRTGDLGRLDPAGRLSLTGRRKLLINRGGFKVNPREVEEAIESHPAVAAVVVVGEPTPYGDERIKAVVVPRLPCTEREIIEHCRARIADFKSPAIVEFRSELPTSPSGKVRRNLL